jgi:hypothetical protein
MEKKTYQGSCHCGRVKFEATFDLSQGTSKCNCTSCWKNRQWSVRVDPQDFRVISGEEELGTPKSPFVSPGGGFCRHCGVKTYVRIAKADWNQGAYVSVSVASLDDLDPAELVSAKVQYMDGRADSWWTVPAEIRHL